MSAITDTLIQAYGMVIAHYEIAAENINWSWLNWVAR